MHDPNASVCLHVKKGKREKSRVLLRVQSKYDVTTVLNKCCMHISWLLFFHS